jgi:uncharacterized membrane protein
VLSLWSKTNGFQPGTWTLDSSAYFSLQAPDEAAAVQWLQSAPPGIIAEAVPQDGGSYTGSARFATLSGQPNVLGWMGHESQWRGGHIEMGSRQDDLVRLYCGRDWEETRAILDQYHVRYVIVGLLERSTYTGNIAACETGLVENKFMRYLTRFSTRTGYNLRVYKMMNNRQPIPRITLEIGLYGAARCWRSCCASTTWGARRLRTAKLAGQ